MGTGREALGEVGGGKDVWQVVPGEGGGGGHLVVVGEPCRIACQYILDEHTRSRLIKFRLMRLTAEM